MKIKNFAIGALAAAMLFTGTSVMEAAVYNTSASRLPTKIDSRCGITEAFLLKNTRFDVKHTMTVNYAEEYVAPCFSRKALETIDLDDVRMKGYGFQIEMKYTAWKLGFELAEVPIIFVNRKLGTSKMSGGIFGEAFWGVIRLKFRKFHRKG